MTLVMTSLENVERLLRSVPPKGLGKITFGDTDASMTEADATAFMEEQESVIISRLGFTPVDPIEPILRALATYCSAYHIFIAVLNRSGGGEIPAQVEKWMEFCEDWLEGILSGKYRGIQPSLTREIQTGPWTNEYLELRDEEHLAPVAGEFLSLAQQWILEETEVIRNEDKTVRYTRNTDYEIFYKSGEIRILSGGSITEDETLNVQYFYMRPKRNEPRPIPSVDAQSIPSLNYVSIPEIYRYGL